MKLHTIVKFFSLSSLLSISIKMSKHKTYRIFPENLFHAPKNMIEPCYTAITHRHGRAYTYKNTDTQAHTHRHTGTHIIRVRVGMRVFVAVRLLYVRYIPVHR